MERSAADLPHRGLNSYRGAPAPAAVVDGYARFQSFSDAARSDIWRVLAPGLLEADLPAARAAFEAFCSDHGVAPQELGAALVALRFLVEGASALNLERAELAEDLARLGDGSGGAAEVLLAHYDEIKGRVRHRIVERTLADHGCVLTGIDWRVDEVRASDRGTDLGISVVLLTLRYREGGEQRRLTLQLTPDGLSQLKAFTNRFS